MGIIQTDGRFTVKTHNNAEGVALGEHPVTVVSSKTLKGDAVHHFIPVRYENEAESGLKINVTGPIENWNIDLTSER